MKAVCPLNPDHKRFETTATEVRDWIVDENGDFLNDLENCRPEVLSGPDPENIWTCYECGAEAEVSE